MKKLLLPCFLVAIFLAGSTGLVENANAQTSTLIQYWNFNWLAASQTFNNPNIPPIKADYSVIDTNTAVLNYILEPGTSSTYAGYLDQYTGDTCNARMGVAAGNSLRVRNPSDSMELQLHIPSTGYQNLVLSWALEASSVGSGQSVQAYDYSTDGGTDWKTSGLTVNGDPVDTLNLGTYLSNGVGIYELKVFGLVTVTFGSDLSVNNNPNLVFRIKFTAQNTGTSGNNRFDNIALDGVGQGSTKPPPASITVLTPELGNILVPGQVDTISFNTQSTVGQVRTIQFSPDSGTTWSPVGMVTGGTKYAWTVPNVQTQQGLIKVTDSANVTGTSTAFVIYPITPSNLIVHYWDFNTLTEEYKLPNIPNFPADFSATSPRGSLQYVLNGLSTSDSGYIDNVIGDSTSADASMRLFGEPYGNALRVRNPTYGMYLEFAIPTTGYQGITISYGLQSSSTSAPQTETFSYSTDGGTIWIASGITVNGAAQNTLNVLQTQYQSPNDGVFAPVTIAFPGLTSLDNNSALMFRIAFSDDSTESSGNNRIDNFTVMATNVLAGVNQQVQVQPLLNLSPNPAMDYISFENPYTSHANVSILDILGEEVYHSDATLSGNVKINTSMLAAGSYYIHIQDVATGAEQIAKFVKQ